MELVLSFSLYVVSGERTQVASLLQCVIALRGEVSPVWALKGKGIPAIQITLELACHVPLNPLLG